MPERSTPTENIVLADQTFNRTDWGRVVNYSLKDTSFVLQAYTRVGQIGGDWATEISLAYYLGLMNRYLDKHPADLRSSHIYHLNLRSSVSEKEDYPVATFEYSPPLTIKTLSAAGHYTEDPSTQIELKWLRVNTPFGGFIYYPAQKHVGSIYTLDANNWEERIEEAADFLDSTSIEIAPKSGKDILMGIIRREYPRPQ